MVGMRLLIKKLEQATPPFHRCPSPLSPPSAPSPPPPSPPPPPPLQSWEDIATWDRELSPDGVLAERWPLRTAS